MPAGIPVAAGAGDTAAAALGSGLGLGEIQLTVGTGAQVIRPLAEAVSRADAGVNLYRSATPDGWYQMGATLSAGLSLNWVREVMNASWAELYASAGHPGRVDDPIFVPHLSGERTPYSDPALRGSWTALRWPATGRRSAVRARGNRVRDPGRPGRPARRAPIRRAGPAGPGAAAAGGRRHPGRRLAAAARGRVGLPLYAVDVPAASGRGAALLGAHAAPLPSFDDIAGAAGSAGLAGWPNRTRP